MSGARRGGRGLRTGFGAAAALTASLTAGCAGLGLNDVDLGLNDVDLGLGRLLGDDAAQADADADGAETAATSAAPATPPEAPRPAGVISPAPPPAAPDGVDPADHGSRLLAAGSADQAERAFRMSLAVDGPSAPAMVGLGAAYRAQGRLGAAREVLERSVELWPQDASARNAHGAALFDARLFAAARSEFEAALRLTPPQDEAARLEIERNLAFAEAALAEADVAPAPAQGPRIAPLGGGRWRLETTG
ncbi:MAG: tetratricopeptide repeat protein [Pseudomonadota bacterium]